LNIFRGPNIQIGPRGSYRTMFLIHIRVYRLFSINEWREHSFDSITEIDSVMANIENNKNGGADSSLSLLPREICILPLACEDIIIQGEFKGQTYNHFVLHPKLINL